MTRTVLPKTPGVSLAEESTVLHERYARAQQIEDATGITFSMEASVMSQWGTPNGSFGAVQTMFTPAVDWAAFSNPWVGAGSFQFHFLSANYHRPPTPRRSATTSTSSA